MECLFNTLKQKVASFNLEGHYLGLSKEAVDKVKRAKQLCVISQDIEGIKSIKKGNHDMTCIFFCPKSTAKLRQSLETGRKRNISKELATAEAALNYAQQPDAFDLIIECDDETDAFEQFDTFLTNHFNKDLKSSKCTVQ